MHWYYTEGELTVKIEGEEHKFSLEQLIRDSSVYKVRRKKVQLCFIILLSVAMGMQLYGGGIPVNQDIYFYIGYFLTPVIIAGIFSSLVFLFLKFRKKEFSKLDTMFQEYLP